jgi:6-phosphofructokinase 1
MKTFFSYRHTQSAVVDQVRIQIGESLGEVFLFEEQPHAEQGFRETINDALSHAENLVVFLGGQLGDIQTEEVRRFRKLIGQRLIRPDGSESERKMAFVCLCETEAARQLFANLKPLMDCDELQRYENYDPNEREELSAANIARWLATTLEVPWQGFDGLPLNPHLFSYEKDIIQFFHDVHRIYPAGRIDPSQATLTEPKDDEIATFIKETWLSGCPVDWPGVPRVGVPVRPNRLLGQRTPDNTLKETKIGTPRPDSAAVVVKALTSASEVLNQEFTVPEAGPREKLYFPVHNTLKVGIVVSGGIAPGVNAVINGIVQRHWQYAKEHGYGSSLSIYGYMDGFLAFREPRVDVAHVILAANDEHVRAKHWVGDVVVTAIHATEGGSLIGTSRVDQLLFAGGRRGGLERIDQRLGDIDILYVVGGDGSMKAAHALYEISRQNTNRHRALSVVAIPKTMDNDVLWVWQSFGFLSAVEKAREVIEQLTTEVQANPRVCVVQLYGSDSGFVVSHAVLASATGHCLAALIPEVPFSMAGLISYLEGRISMGDDRPPKGIIVMAETAIPTDAMEYLRCHDAGLSEHDVGLTKEERNQIEVFNAMRKSGKRIEGQTNDALRSAGLKIVSHGLQYMLGRDDAGQFKDGWDLLRVVKNEPRHLLRAIKPSCLDIIVGQRLGTLAVDNAVAGYTDFMISQWLTEYVLVPLRLVVLGRKRIPELGMFWKSVLAATGQPGDVVDVSPEFEAHWQSLLDAPRRVGSQRKAARAD